MEASLSLVMESVGGRHEYGASTFPVVQLVTVFVLFMYFLLQNDRTLKKKKKADGVKHKYVSIHRFPATQVFWSILHMLLT